MEDLKGFLFWSALTLFAVLAVVAVLRIADQEVVAAEDDSNPKPSLAIDPAKALTSARQRIQRYGDGEGWDRSFVKEAALSSSGYVCGYLYGETHKDYGWEFTVRFIYDPAADEVEVLNWASINHSPWFEEKWARLCPTRVGHYLDVAETKESPKEKLPESLECAPGTCPRNSLEE